MIQNQLPVRTKGECSQMPAQKDGVAQISRRMESALNYLCGEKVE